MSDESDSVLSDQVEEQKQDSETVRINNQGPSDKSFYDKVDEFQNGEREENPWKEVTKWKVYGYIMGSVLVLILSIILSFNGHFGWGVILFFSPFIIPLVLTETGRMSMKELQEELVRNQSSQRSTKSNPKRICSECGWQNPKENSFCYDCGSELGKSG